MNLAGKVVLVTGAARGIGAAISVRLWQEGMFVYAADIDEEALAGAAPAGADERWIPAGVDITDRGSIDRLIAAIGLRFGVLHGLVNNAAMLDASLLAELDYDRYRRVVATNLDGALLCVLSALELIKASAPSAIVNIASIMGMAGLRDAIPYSTAKAGLINMTRNLAVELAPQSIRLNAVAPGFIDTRMARLADGSSEYATEEFREVYLKHRRLPLGHPGTAEDIAGPVAFLLSSDARYITGHTLVVDGGVTATY
ncbi:SDR family NAD(P)-dependent oxidoreductase [Sinorhizobium medicae]|uniref:SDR family NAD(P)-dependent oxidoreductase n=1 Tax=Sinorhizobium medicae TaxID=110321 RepID=UPI000FD79143|nr:SDR family NAD(P)-dependent oxidoreductase [Sinorhizobium medicae]RVJ38966.1 SDR family oxidoreductase [Sinorhizobium medicae]